MNRHICAISLSVILLTQIATFGAGNFIQDSKLIPSAYAHSINSNPNSKATIIKIELRSVTYTDSSNADHPQRNSPNYRFCWDIIEPLHTQEVKKCIDLSTTGDPVTIKRQTQSDYWDILKGGDKPHTYRTINLKSIKLPVYTHTTCYPPQSEALISVFGYKSRFIPPDPYNDPTWPILDAIKDHVVGEVGKKMVAKAGQDIATSTWNKALKEAADELSNIASKVGSLNYVTQFGLTMLLKGDGDMGSATKIIPLPLGKSQAKIETKGKDGSMTAFFDVTVEKQEKISLEGCENRVEKKTSYRVGESNEENPIPPWFTDTALAGWLAGTISDKEILQAAKYLATGDTTKIKSAKIPSYFKTTAAAVIAGDISANSWLQSAGYAANVGIISESNESGNIISYSPIDKQTSESQWNDKYEDIKKPHNESFFEQIESNTKGVRSLDVDLPPLDQSQVEKQPDGSTIITDTQTGQTYEFGPEYDVSRSGYLEPYGHSWEIVGNGDTEYVRINDFDNGVKAVSVDSSVYFLDPDGEVEIYTENFRNGIPEYITQSIDSEGNLVVENHSRGATTTIITTDDKQIIKKPDGTITTRYGSGDNIDRIETKKPDGTTVTTYPQGTKIIKHTDGTIVTTKPDGTTVTEKGDTTWTIQPDGTRITEKGDTTWTIQPDGTRITETGDGKKIYQNPDGTYHVFNPDGSITTRLSDGTVITQWPDGTRKVTKGDSLDVPESPNAPEEHPKDTEETTKEEPIDIDCDNSDFSQFSVSVRPGDSNRWVGESWQVTVDVTNNGDSKCKADLDQEFGGSVTMKMDPVSPSFTTGYITYEPHHIQRFYFIASCGSEGSGQYGVSLDSYRGEIEEIVNVDCKKPYIEEDTSSFRPPQEPEPIGDPPQESEDPCENPPARPDDRTIPRFGNQSVEETSGDTATITQPVTVNWLSDGSTVDCGNISVRVVDYQTNTSYSQVLPLENGIANVLVDTTSDSTTFQVIVDSVTYGDTEYPSGISITVSSAIDELVKGEVATTG